MTFDEWLGAYTVEHGDAFATREVVFALRACWNEALVTGQRTEILHELLPIELQPAKYMDNLAQAVIIGYGRHLHDHPRTMHLAPTDDAIAAMRKTLRELIFKRTDAG